jgi:hypothetical protein
VPQGSLAATQVRWDEREEREVAAVRETQSTPRGAGHPAWDMYRAHEAPAQVASLMVNQKDAGPLVASAGAGSARSWGMFAQMTPSNERRARPGVESSRQVLADRVAREPPTEPFFVYRDPQVSTSTSP